MTARNSPNGPFVIQANAHSSEVLRQMLASISPTPGTVNFGDLAVTQNGTPNMSVNVASGFAIIAGTQSVPTQGAYHVYNDATVNLAVAASNPTNPRIDIVVAQVLDAAYSGASNLWQLAVVTGTPAGSPVAPAAPANSITLANVAVAANATTVVTANITDQRVQCSETAQPRGVPAGGYAQSTTSVSGITTETTSGQTGMPAAVTVTVGTNRRIKITAFTPEVTSTIDGDVIEVRIKEGATRLQAADVTAASNNGGSFAMPVWVGTPTAGSHTYYVSCLRAAGTGSGTFAGTTTSQSFILVEDIGSAGP